MGSYDDLATHHPKSNFNARMVDGTLQNVERPQRRSHAYIDGEYQEVEMLRTDEYRSLQPDQVLIIKDFILEDAPPKSARTRVVDVPAPVAGYVSRRDDRNGLVEITDKQDGDVIARIRHLGPIAVEEGQTLAYGQSLGTQNAIGLPKGAGKHVHIEMDTGHAQQFENYVNDLASGRLPVQAEHRADVQPLPATGDRTFRLGESNERIRELQRVMAGEGYLATGGHALDQDGVYRPNMQGALLDFQRAHGLQQTGNIDPATLQMAPQPQRREIDREDTFVPGRPMPTPPAAKPKAPGHPDHPDHRQNLANPLPLPVNRPAPDPRHSPDDPNHPDHAMLEQIREGVRKVDEGIDKPYDDMSERMSRCLLVECKESGLRRVDHVVMGINRTNLFAVEGTLTDPAHARAHVPMEQAIRTPVEQSDERLLAVNQAIAQKQELAQQQELARGPEEQARNGQAMRM